jgi:hypothetical protein
MAGTVIADRLEAASTSQLVIENGVALTPPTIVDVNNVQIGTFCRAWVNFNGTGTVAIRASFNVTSITDNGTGDYTVNFTNAMPDANYSTLVSTQGANTSNLSGEQGLYGTSTGGAQLVAPTTSAFRVTTWTSSLSGQADTAYVMAAVFR